MNLGVVSIAWDSLEASGSLAEYASLHVLRFFEDARAILATVNNFHNPIVLTEELNLYSMSQTTIDRLQEDSFMRDWSSSIVLSLWWSGACDCDACFRCFIEEGMI